MQKNNDSDISDRVYEAAAIPELWPEVCDRISREIGAYSTAVITLAPGAPLRWTSSACIAEHMETYEKSGLADRSERPKRGLEKAPNFFLRDVDLFTTKELTTELVRRELLEPIGLAWEMGAAFMEPSGSLFIFSQLMKTECGPFSEKAVARMNQLKPDLARAAFLATRLGLREAQSIAQSLSLVGLASAVIGDDGSVVATNEEFEALAPQVSTGANDRLIINNPNAQALYASALAQIKIGFAAPVQSIPVVSRDDLKRLIVHLMPIRRAARDVFQRSCALAVITPVGETGSTDMRVICGLFDLTKTEAIVAQKIASGLSIEEVAIVMRISRETVRSHLKSVFHKTGAKRQVQLVRLLVGLRSVGEHVTR
ncbi:DNA-binding transcriptional regulator, CsgD family [Rhizobium sp. RU33A]|uniref:helix-turn-helix transcriptional regulator n=1 Tax=Rhizobium sp. RU33A TaxID=1907413 RepID=UPI00095728BE|nr:helix-turn-helix transcriptional regulator [Rhizobium sp. RU33A]SIQ89593.1 DNA-binding transcriptional regulator, CsgD family [Rhizobium sp. RU33A]